MSSPTFAGIYKSLPTQFGFSGPLAQVCYYGGPNGSRIHRVSLATTQTTSMPTVTLYKGTVLTDNTRAYPGARPGLGLCPIIAVGSTTTITRTNGSFIIDGWTIGQKIALINDTASVGNNVVALIHASTAVAAATITLAAAGPTTT